MTPARFDRRARYVLQLRKHESEKDARREDNALYRAAWICATIMNFAGKQLKGERQVKPDELLIEKQTPDIIQEKRRILVERHNLDKRFGIHAQPYGAA